MITGEKLRNILKEAGAVFNTYNIDDYMSKAIYGPEQEIFLKKYLQEGEGNQIEIAEFVSKNEKEYGIDIKVELIGKDIFRLWLTKLDENVYFQAFIDRNKIDKETIIYRNKNFTIEKFHDTNRVCITEYGHIIGQLKLDTWNDIFPNDKKINIEEILLNLNNQPKR